MIPGSSKLYEGENHVFTSDNTVGVNIQAGSGKELHITCNSLDPDSININGLTITAHPPEPYTIILPEDPPEAGKVMVSDAEGQLVWSNNGTATNPSGSDTEVQFNDGGTFGAVPEFTYNKDTEILAAPTINATSELRVGLIPVSIRSDAFTNYSLVLPSDQGLPGQTLENDGTGNLTWVDKVVPSGLDTYVQFNDGGEFGSDSTFNFDKTGSILNVPNIVCDTVASTAVSVGSTTITTASTGPVSLVLPSNDGNSGEVLTTDGLGTLSWTENLTDPAGSNTQVQFNNSGVFGADSSFTYDNSTNTLRSDNTISNVFSSEINTDYFGTNSLSNPANLNTFASSNNNGTSVTITKYNQAIYNENAGPLPLRTRIYSGCTYDGGNPSWFGGIITGYNSDSGTFPNGQSTLVIPEFGTDLYLGDIDTNEDGSFTTADEPTTYTRVFAYLSYGNLSTTGWPQIFTGFTKSRISGNYLLATNESNNLSVYFYNGSTFVLQQQISSAAISCFDISGGNLVHFLSGTSVYAWVRSGTTWIYSNSIVVGSGVSKIVADGNILVTKKTDYVTIYESSTEVMNVLDPGVNDICTDGANYVIYATGGTDLRVISKTSGTWTLQANPTVTNNIFSLACNSNYLVVGRPNANGVTGIATVYNITAYESEMIPNNVLDLTNSGVDLAITSTYGSITATSDNFTVASTMNVTGNFTLGSSIYYGSLLGSLPRIISKVTYTNVNSISSISIPSGVTHLRIVTYLYRASGSTTAYIGIRFNGDFVNNSKNTGKNRQKPKNNNN